MFNPIIETAIGLVFVYLLLSMVCSALQEWIATLFGLRAKTLFEGISKMLCGDTNLRDQIYAHPLVDGLSRKTWLDTLFKRPARPSYIAPETFSKAFLAAANVPQALAANVAPAQASNNQPLHANTRKLITTLAEVAPGDLDNLRKNVEDWYNDAMDRVSGWYKRQTQGILLILGLLIAIAFNADSLMLARAFWADPNLRAGVVVAAQQYVRDHPNGIDSPSIAANAQLSNAAPAGEQAAATDIAKNYPSTTDEKPAPPPAAEPAYSAQQVERAEQQYRAASAYVQQTSSDAWTQLSNLKVPIGWCSGNAASGPTAEQVTTEPDFDGEEGEQTGLPCTPDRQLPRDRSAWLLKISGLLITTVALSQGAPFWFDLLKKVVNLRLAGDAPDEKKK